jgi:hypothetical protein
VHVRKHLLGALGVKHLVTDTIRRAILAAQTARDLEHARAIANFASNTAGRIVAVERHAILAAIANDCHRTGVVSG